MSLLVCHGHYTMSMTGSLTLVWEEECRPEQGLSATQHGVELPVERTVDVDQGCRWTLVLARSDDDERMWDAATRLHPHDDRLTSAAV